MSALVLDAGAFLAVERDDRVVMARLRAAHRHGFDLRTSAIVLGQVWRSGEGRQARLSRFLRAVDVRSVSQVGVGDLGVNAARIDQYLDVLGHGH